MNETRVGVEERLKQYDLYVRIGGQFQAVTIKKEDGRHEVARALHELAQNIEHDESKGSPPEDKQARCKDCSFWKPGLHLTGCRLYAQRDRAPQWGDAACEDYKPKVKRVSA